MTGEYYTFDELELLKQFGCSDPDNITQGVITELYSVSEIRSDAQTFVQNLLKKILEENS